MILNTGKLNLHLNKLITIIKPLDSPGGSNLTTKEEGQVPPIPMKMINNHS